MSVSNATMIGTAVPKSIESNAAASAAPSCDDDDDDAAATDDAKAYNGFAESHSDSSQN